MAKMEEQDFSEVVGHVLDTYTNYKTLSEDYRNRMEKVYETFTSYVMRDEEKQNEWSGSYKVNKSHEVVEKVIPRIIAKNPRWLVTPKTDEFSSDEKNISPEERGELLEKHQEFALGVQDYLTYIFDTYNLREPIRRWAKYMIVYGNAYAKIKYKYETTKIKGKNRITEKVTGEYPTIDVVPFTNFFVDPRYPSISEMPAVIEHIDGVRLDDLKRRAEVEEYFNLEKFDELPSGELFGRDPTDYRTRIEQIAGITGSNLESPIDLNSLSVTTYYGIYQQEEDDEEKLYQITLIDNSFIIQMKEITYIPFVDIKSFEDTDNYYGWGFVEPMMGIQEEMNFKKNSASEYINHALNRSWIWSPNSGVNPSDLVSRPNNIIATDRDANTAMANLIELPQREIPSSYFSEQNDLERQIQAATFTVDTANPRTQNSLTNTATGARIKFFESNSVINEVRKHFENGLERLAYFLLISTFENLENNIVIKKQGTEGFWEINKELLRDAITKYNVRVEVNSSSFEDLESRREDAIAFFNTVIQGKQAGLDVNIEEAFKDVINTFEKRDVNRFIGGQEDVKDLLQGGVPTGPIGGATIDQPEPQGSPVADLTRAVAQGNITNA